MHCSTLAHHSVPQVYIINMVNEKFLIQLQDKIGYRFKDATLLDLALTAPGVEGKKEGNKEEQDLYNGNRKLAQLGDSLLPLVVRKKALYDEEASLSIF
jgi:dsRNA-specific ribonuclease